MREIDPNADKLQSALAGLEVARAVILAKRLRDQHDATITQSELIFRNSDKIADIRGIHPEFEEVPHDIPSAKTDESLFEDFKESVRFQQTSNVRLFTDEHVHVANQHDIS